MAFPDFHLTVDDLVAEGTRSPFGGHPRARSEARSPELRPRGNESTWQTVAPSRTPNIWRSSRRVCSVRLCERPPIVIAAARRAFTRVFETNSPDTESGESCRNIPQTRHALDDPNEGRYAERSTRLQGARDPLLLRRLEALDDWCGREPIESGRRLLTRLAQKATNPNSGSSPKYTCPTVSNRLAETKPWCRTVSASRKCRSSR